MPIEIRELSISTKIKSKDSVQPSLSSTELQKIKKQVVQECSKLLLSNARKNGFNR